MGHSAVLTAGRVISSTFVCVFAAFIIQLR